MNETDAYNADNVIYWLWLQRKLGIPSRSVSAVNELDGGARRVYESTPDELWKMGVFSVKTVNALSDRSLDADERTLKQCEKLGISITYPGDINYPPQLLNIPDPPAVLFYKGDLAQTANRPCIAMVGTRKATGYGTEAAETLARRLSRGGMTVVSGAAKGIDTAAHEGALDNPGGRTIAVLGCGIDHPYNAANKLLRERIVSRGAVVSEYPPGSEPNPHHFPIRNRLISGLSLGTVVVEADSDSGSLITARMACEQGRDVFAMPTGVGMPNSSGIRLLFNEGMAKAVYSPLDVLEEYYAQYPGHLSLDGAEAEIMFGNEPQRAPDTARKSKRITAQQTEDTSGEDSAGSLPECISEEARRLYHYLRGVPQLADVIAAQAGISPDEASSLLFELEMNGAAKPHPGGKYSL